MDQHECPSTVAPTHMSPYFPGTVDHVASVRLAGYGVLSSFQNGTFNYAVSVSVTP